MRTETAHLTITARGSRLHLEQGDSVTHDYGLLESDAAPREAAERLLTESGGRPVGEWVQTFGGVTARIYVRDYEFADDSTGKAET